MPQQDITIWMWLAALAPPAAILSLLIDRHWKAATAVPVGYSGAAVIAAAVFQASNRGTALFTEPIAKVRIWKPVRGMMKIQPKEWRGRGLDPPIMPVW